MSKKTFLIAGLSALMILSVPIHAEAPVERDNRADPGYSTTATPRYTHIQSFNTECVVADGYAELLATAFAREASSKVSLSMTLQKQNGSQWQNVKTWTASGSGAAGADLTKTYAITSGNYRVKTTAKILDGTKVLETATIYG